LVVVVIKLIILSYNVYLPGVVKINSLEQLCTLGCKK
jgi:hypothetical protein